jgi:type IV secretion system protein VirB4
MLNLREYRNSADRLADHLPWGLLVAPGVILNKDGSFQQSFGFRGPDLESASSSELVSICARANNVLRRFGSGWALFFEAERREALGYSVSAFPDVASSLVEAERANSFNAAQNGHFESHYYLTLVWMPPADQLDGVSRKMVDRGTGGQTRNWHEVLNQFCAQTARAFDLFSGFMPEIIMLDDEATLTYLHGTVSTTRHRVAVPDTPLYLDAILADTPVTGGLEPRLGSAHLRTLTILGFPNMSRPGLLDALNHQAFGYRWMSRFIALDKAQATKTLTSLRRQWFSKRKSITALVREVMYNQPAQLLDSDADNKVIDCDEALQALGGDHVGFGYLTTTITVSDIDPKAADDKLRSVQRIINGLGFTCIAESVNALEAWLSSLPGQVYANVRQPLVHTLNLAHLVPLSCVWAGPPGNAHLDGPPLLYAETSGTTPFRLSTHVGDVGHMLIVGPTGAGKSVLLSLLALQFRRYPDAQITIFDKGLSARAAVLAMGGKHHALGTARASTKPGDDAGSKAVLPLAFQPLRRIDLMEEKIWAAQWIGGLLAHEGVTVTPLIKEQVWSALSSLAAAYFHERTMTGLVLLLQSNALKAALAPYTLEGAYGHLLDACVDGLALSDLQCFETESLLHTPGAVLPVLTYLFHRLEARFDGRPALLILDEAWVFLDHPLFAARIREWLKTLRKKNVSVIFATQSLADIAESSIAPAILESCPQRIFLPNARAAEPQSQAAYTAFGLSERQIELIASATPKRQYYLQSAAGNRLFDLKLGAITLALAGASDAASQAVIHQILANGEDEAFLPQFLDRVGLDWAAALARDLEQSRTYEGEDQ